MNGKHLPTDVNGPRWTDQLESLYGADALIRVRERYAALVEGVSPKNGFPAVEATFAQGGFRLFSAPGRTELGGNHTDHNRGRVLAASVQLDAVALVAGRNDDRVFLRSAGFPDTLVNLRDGASRPDLSPKQEERGTTAALVRGIIGKFSGSCE